MEEKLVCCWGSGAWTRIIGWIQLVVAGIVIIIMSISLAKYSRITDWEDTLPPIVVISAVSTLALEVLAFIMSSLLLFGSYKRKGRLIYAWLVYAILSFLFWLFLALTPSYVEHSGQMNSASIISIVSSLVIQLLSMWVVALHAKEIKSFARANAAVQV